MDLDLKIGDKVIVSNGHWNRFDVVERITPSGQVKLKDWDTKFKDGKEIGASGWYIPYLYEWTQEKEDKIKHKAKKIKIQKSLREFEFNLLTDEDLNTIHDIISKSEYQNIL